MQFVLAHKYPCHVFVGGNKTEKKKSLIDWRHSEDTAHLIGIGRRNIGSMVFVRTFGMIWRNECNALHQSSSEEEEENKKTLSAVVIVAWNVP